MKTLFVAVVALEAINAPFSPLYVAFVNACIIPLTSNV